LNTQKLQRPVGRIARYFLEFEEHP
jgi:hypothetical protein